jgi:chemosensory pili system protein ChpA (sensor histidine kinase/response regulator)
MPDTLSDDINIEFLNELKGYIPLMRDKVDRINCQSPEASKTHFTELHRLVHAIRGASALLKLNNLSKVASEIERVVEEIIKERLTFDTAILAAFTNAIEYFDTYTQEVPCNDEFNQDLRTDVLDSLIAVRGHASSNDEQDFISQLLETVDQDEESPLVSDADDLSIDDDDLSIDDIDEAADDFALAEDDFADVAGRRHLDDDAHTTAERPLGQTDDSACDTQISKEPESIVPPQDELLEGFYQEAEDHFQDLGRAIGQLEKRISEPTTMGPDDKELLRLIRRSVHTVKGAAAVVELRPIAQWGHEFENLLDWLYEEADLLIPDDIEIIAYAADMLERFVTDPQNIDPDQVHQLKRKLKQIIDSNPGEENVKENESASTSAGFVEVLVPDDNQHDTGSGEHEIDARKAPPPSLDQTKTMRIDLAKVGSLVNLGGELTIALSAFDQDMDGLGNLIGEIDRTQSRLKKTARDLELGYELKAISRTGPAGPQADSPATVREKAAALTEFDLLELDRYSELNLIIRSLSETAADAGTISQHLSKIHSGFKGILHRLQLLVSDLNAKTTRMRMTPMSSITNRMRRTVRETATHLGKKAQLITQGEHVELDKMVWDKLADPLMHLLRNAVDHGIESQAVRRDAGKPETAVIRLEAAYQGNQVVIRIADDGAGLDYDAIRKTVASPDPDKTGDEITDQEITEMIFQPGLSTCQTISEVSGRGVGLDVVKENILGLKGSVRVENSEEGVGTTFAINLPLTMAVINALLFDIAGKRYATALYDIKEILRVNPKDIETKGKKALHIGNRRIPYYDLSKILAEPELEPEAGDAHKWPLLLIVEKESWQGAVAIDRIYSQRDIVIKSLGSHLGHVKGIAGATVMGDGQVVPILNLEELLHVETGLTDQPHRFKPKDRMPRPLEIMVVDDSVTIRNVVSNLMQRQGWKVLTAKDGLEAIEVLHTWQPDLIILDIEMPRMNGYEFMSSMRAQEKFKDLPVIMHTSRGSKKHREKAESLGVNAFVTKPYEEEYFIAMIKDLSSNHPPKRILVPDRGGGII